MVTAVSAKAEIKSIVFGEGFAMGTPPVWFGAPHLRQLSVGEVMGLRSNARRSSRSPNPITRAAMNECSPRGLERAAGEEKGLNPALRVLQVGVASSTTQG